MNLRMILVQCIRIFNLVWKKCTILIKKCLACFGKWRRDYWSLRKRTLRIYMCFNVVFEYNFERELKDPRVIFGLKLKKKCFKEKLNFLLFFLESECFEYCRSNSLIYLSFFFSSNWKLRSQRVETQARYKCALLNNIWFLNWFFWE